MTGSSQPALTDAVARVLAVAELIPSGHVASYGELGTIVGRGPRFVGRVMAIWGGAVPWWRVTNAEGDLPEHLRPAAFAHWAEEGIAVKPNGRGCRISAFGADLDALAREFHLSSGS